MKTNLFILFTCLIKDHQSQTFPIKKSSHFLEAPAEYFLVESLFCRILYWKVFWKSPVRKSQEKPERIRIPRENLIEQMQIFKILRASTVLWLYFPDTYGQILYFPINIWLPLVKSIIKWKTLCEFRYKTYIYLYMFQISISFIW